MKIVDFQAFFLWWVPECVLGLVAVLVENHGSTPPIYFLGRTYVLHTRINGRQVKRTLRTSRSSSVMASISIRSRSMAISTLNDYLMRNGVIFELRCQFMGHKIDHVNVAVYRAGKPAQKFTLDEVANTVAKSQTDLMDLIEFVAMTEALPSLATDSTQTQ